MRAGSVRPPRSPHHACSGTARPARVHSSLVSGEALHCGPAVTAGFEGTKGLAPAPATREASGQKARLRSRVPGDRRCRGKCYKKNRGTEWEPRGRHLARLLGGSRRCSDFPSEECPWPSMRKSERVSCPHEPPSPPRPRCGDNSLRRPSKAQEVRSHKKRALTGSGRERADVPFGSKGKVWLGREAPSRDSRPASGEAVWTHAGGEAAGLPWARPCPPAAWPRPCRASAGSSP